MVIGGRFRWFMHFLRYYLPGRWVLAADQIEHEVQRRERQYTKRTGAPKDDLREFHPREYSRARPLQPASVVSHVTLDNPRGAEPLLRLPAGTSRFSQSLTKSDQRVGPAPPGGAPSPTEDASP